VDPIEKPTNQEQDEEILPLPRPTAIDTEVNRAEPVPVAARGSLFLFHYVTMLVSGLVLLGLTSLTGYSLLDHWLGEADKANAFDDFVYSFHLYLIVSVVLFGGLHIWMRLLIKKAERDDQSALLRVFLAIFLTILALTAVSAFGGVVYLAVDTLLGTGNYSAKGAWLIILSALQTVVWSALLWWYFKRSRTMAIRYAVAVGFVCAAAVILLIVFPVFSRRDTVIDSRTTSDLTAIVSAIGEYAQKNSKLPATLRDLTFDEKVTSRIGSYEYQINQTRASLAEPEQDLFYKPSSQVFSYKLCAHFKTDTAKTDKNKPPIVPLIYSPSELSYHPAGRHCFDRTAYGASSSGSSESSRPMQPVDASLLDSAPPY
jgi:hypothetical protein